MNETIAARRADAIAALNSLEAEDFAPVLEAAAQNCRESGAELAGAWGDKGPQRVWDNVAKALEAAAGKVA